MNAFSKTNAILCGEIVIEVHEEKGVLRRKEKRRVTRRNTSQNHNKKNLYFIINDHI